MDDRASGAHDESFEGLEAVWCEFARFDCCSKKVEGSLTRRKIDPPSPCQALCYRPASHWFNKATRVFRSAFSNECERKPDVLM